ncbi:MAG: hypothetical protein JW969_11955 [Spirochaetales bacterium]|nr:hypothetical protein [Spirochaetales bacterium]
MPIKSLCTLSLIMFISCGPLPDGRAFLKSDFLPPVFQSIQQDENSCIELIFNEKVRVKAETLAIEPAIAVNEINYKETSVIINTGNQEPGKAYILSACFEDLSGNSTVIMYKFYGYNPDVPKILINEFITNGSKTHPDIAELKIMKGGNMGGIAFYQGTPADYADRLIFPPFHVQDGDFILVHFKPEGLATEINETENKSQATGIDAKDSAYDFWLKDSRGISGNNGVLSLYTNPAGTVIDGILYSNRNSGSDENYLGFGTRYTMERAINLVKDHGWVIQEEEVRPEDGFNPDGSTSTRSICRTVRGTDTDSKKDFHIVPTGKSSFGEENSDEIFEPDN